MANVHVMQAAEYFATALPRVQHTIPYEGTVCIRLTDKVWVHCTPQEWQHLVDDVATNMREVVGHGNA